MFTLSDCRTPPWDFCFWVVSFGIKHCQCLEMPLVGQFFQISLSFFISNFFIVFLQSSVSSFDSKLSFILLIRLYKNDSKTIILNLWVVTPFGVSYQISWISDMLITIHNSRKIIVIKEQKIILCLWILTTWGTILEGHSIRKVENHWLKS